jgi:hypothetical protein
MGGKLIVRRLHQIFVDRAKQSRSHGTAERACDHGGGAGQRDDQQGIKGAIIRHAVQFLGNELGEMRLLLLVEIVSRGERVMGGRIAVERGPGRIRAEIGGSLVSGHRIEFLLGSQHPIGTTANKAGMSTIGKHNHQV